MGDLGPRRRPLPGRVIVPVELHQVAQRFVALDADLAGPTTLNNLREAIKVCMRASAQMLA